MRFISDTDVGRLVTPGDALHAVRAAFEELAAGTAAVQQRARTSAGGAKLSTLGAVLQQRAVLGAKVYATVGDEFTFLIALFSADDGRRLAVLESDTLTRLRTAATSVLSAQVLASRVPGRLVLFGTGAQATGHALAFADRFPLELITFVGRSARPEVARQISALTGVAARSVATELGEDAVSDADVVVTATRSVTPVLCGRALTAGTHVCAVGSSRPEARELDDDVYRRAAVVVEWREQARHEAGGLITAAAQGLLSWDDVTELADALGAGGGPDRSGVSAPSRDLTLFQSVGIGLEDIAVAAVAWQRAEANGAGEVVA